VQQRCREDGTVFGFGAAAMLSGSLLQGSHHGLIYAPHQKVSHHKAPDCYQC
jgi:hypothetical protein